MIALLIATTNRGKQRELAQLLNDWPVQLVFPQDLGLTQEVPETATSFAEIAAQKALVYARLGGRPALADDSGLEVDALNGAPGIYTARYAGPGASDQDRYQKLLTELQGVPQPQRTARFRCAIALAQPQSKVRLVEGVCEGQIALEPRGRNGFGYDPIFYLPEWGCTMAELGQTIKNQISHRARAVRMARRLIDELLQADHAPR